MPTGGEAERSARATEILRDAGSILTGDHFVYVTGEHGDGWIDKDAIFPHTELTSELCRMLAEAVADLDLEYVCGPATRGLVVSQWTAHHLGVPSVFAEHAKEQGYTPQTAGDGPLRAPFVLARGYDRLVDGARVIVVDDVVNTGHSVRETVETVTGAGGTVVAVGALCTRGNAARRRSRLPDVRRPDPDRDPVLGRRRLPPVRRRGPGQHPVRPRSRFPRRPRGALTRASRPHGAPPAG